MRKSLVRCAGLVLLSLGLGAVGGCQSTDAGGVATSQPELSPEAREARVLSGITQLTSFRDFEKAGEAYFSKDMRWVVFQAVPKPQPRQAAETNYQMYVARLVYVKGEPAGLVVVTRLTPPGSRNTCGWFSPDGGTLLFASTAGKDDPDEASPGYQRAGSRYRWAFSKGMEIYKVTDWEQKVTAAAVGGYVNLALPANRMTENDSYDAECSISPDGEWVVFCSDRPTTVKEMESPATQPAARPKQLWAMRMDGTDLVQLTATAGYNGGPFFSPNQKQLLYRSDRKGNDLLQVMVSDIVWEGGWGKPRKIVGLKNERAITDDANVNWGPYWTPDAERIVYATSKISHANYEIFFRRADGSHETRITFAPGPDVLPVISPDGKYMMWTSRRGESTQIYIARIQFPEGS